MERYEKFKKNIKGHVAGYRRPVFPNRLFAHAWGIVWIIFLVGAAVELGS